MNFKVWDWNKGEWVNHCEYDDLLMFNWYTSGDQEGECWPEVKDGIGRSLNIVYRNEDGEFEEP